jgi:hypothetical protein
MAPNLCSKRIGSDEPNDDDEASKRHQRMFRLRKAEVFSGGRRGSFLGHMDTQRGLTPILLPACASSWWRMRR